MGKWHAANCANKINGRLIRIWLFGLLEGRRGIGARSVVMTIHFTKGLIKPSETSAKPQSPTINLEVVATSALYPTARLKLLARVGDAKQND